jgi:hypothetical protein
VDTTSSFEIIVDNLLRMKEDEAKRYMLIGDNESATAPWHRDQSAGKLYKSAEVGDPLMHIR